MINSENTLLMIIDIQEKLVKMLGETNIAKNASILAKTFDTLNMPILITEQYPKGLGGTIDEVKNIANNAIFMEKEHFSAYKKEDIKVEIEKFGKKNVIICGIEAHICVLQTALDLKNAGYNVYFVTDASASRKAEDYEVCLEFLKQNNIYTITTEIALFTLLESSKHPNFKELQALIK